MLHLQHCMQLHTGIAGSECMARVLQAVLAAGGWQCPCHRLASQPLLQQLTD
jgi:hypothetical protein